MVLNKRHIRRREFITRSLCAASGVFAGCYGQTDSPTNAPPNFLFIIDDQHSARAMGWTGDWPIHTPALDRLAGEGVAFSNAYCATPLCSPNRNSLITGLFASEHGVFRNEILTRDDVPTLLDHLNKVGYTTASIGKMHNAPYHLRRGYQFVLHHEYFDGPLPISHYAPYLDTMLEKRGLEWPVWWNSPSGKAFGTDMSVMAGTHWLPEDLLPERWTTDQALAFLSDHAANRKDKPFFLHVSYFGPHDPYRPIQKYTDIYEGADIPLPPNFDRAKADTWCEEAKTGPLSDNEYRRVRRCYSALVSQVDDHIGMLLRGLETLGLSDKTVVIFTSDHGDMMGEHGRMRKNVLYEGAERIPLIVRWPGVTTPRLETSLVSFLDLMPTILSAAGVEPDAHLPGRNLFPLLSRAQQWPNRAVIAESFHHGREYPSLMIRQGPHKLVAERIDRSTGDCTYRLHNIDEDRWEQRDLLHDPESAAILRELKDQLRAHLDRQSPFLDRLDPTEIKRPGFLYRVPWPADPWTPVEPSGNVPYWTLRMDQPWRV